MIENKIDKYIGESYTARHYKKLSQKTKKMIDKYNILLLSVEDVVSGKFYEDQGIYNQLNDLFDKILDSIFEDGVNSVE